MRIVSYVDEGLGHSSFGWLVELDRPLLFVADPDQDRDGFVRQCLDVGHEALRGELDGGLDEWAAWQQRRLDVLP